MIQNYIAAEQKPKYIAAPLASALHDLCMEHGRDLHTHADYIPGALDASCIDGLGGFATCIDSLAAIKHLIYDTNKLTWDQLLEALEKNWEGNQAVRQLCIHAPKVRKRNRVGRCDWLRDSKSGDGIRSQPSPAAWTERKHAHHSNYVSQSLWKGHHGNAQW